MTQERQDGWYWVRSDHFYPSDPRWKVGCLKNGLWHVAGFNAMNDSALTDIGPRIPSPDEPKDPDLLAVVAAAKDLLEYGDICGCETCQCHADALRSALANLKLEERES